MRRSLLFRFLIVATPILLTGVIAMGAWQVLSKYVPSFPIVEQRDRVWHHYITTENHGGYRVAMDVAAGGTQMKLTLSSTSYKSKYIDINAEYRDGVEVALKASLSNESGQFRDAQSDAEARSVVNQAISETIGHGSIFPTSR